MENLNTQIWYEESCCEIWLNQIKTKEQKMLTMGNSQAVTCPLCHEKDIKKDKFREHIIQTCVEAKN